MHFSFDFGKPGNAVEALEEVLGNWCCREYIAKELFSSPKGLGNPDNIGKIMVLVRKAMECADINVFFEFSRKEVVIQDDTKVQWRMKGKYAKPLPLRTVKLTGGNWLNTNEVIFENIPKVFRKMLIDSFRESAEAGVSLQTFYKSRWWLHLGRTFEVNYALRPDENVSRYFAEEPSCQVFSRNIDDFE